MISGCLRNNNSGFVRPIKPRLDDYIEVIPNHPVHILVYILRWAFKLNWIIMGFLECLMRFDLSLIHACLLVDTRRIVVLRKYNQTFEILSKFINEYFQSISTIIQDLASGAGSHLVEVGSHLRHTHAG